MDFFLIFLFDYSIPFYHVLFFHFDPRSFDFWFLSNLFCVIFIGLQFHPQNKYVVYYYCFSIWFDFFCSFFKLFFFLILPFNKKFMVALYFWFWILLCDWFFFFFQSHPSLFELLGIEFHGYVRCFQSENLDHEFEKLMRVNIFFNFFFVLSFNINFFIWFYNFLYFIFYWVILILWPGSWIR